MVGSHLTEHDLLVMEKFGGLDMKAWKEQRAKKKRFELKEQRTFEAEKAQAAIEELRIFECGHGYHKKCIDEAQRQEKEKPEEEPTIDNFFDQTRVGGNNRLTFYQLMQIEQATSIKSKLEIKCIRCHKY